MQRKDVLFHSLQQDQQSLSGSNRWTFGRYIPASMRQGGRSLVSQGHPLGPAQPSNHWTRGRLYHPPDDLFPNSLPSGDTITPERTLFAAAKDG